MRAQVSELRAAMAQIGTRLDSLEGRLNTMADKVDATRSSVETLVGNSRLGKTGVTHAPSEGSGTRVGAETAATDPEGGFINDAAVQSYRKAMVLFDARKYPEAILGFSSFLDQYPDHPLAGSAQFFVGESYFREGQFRLATQELKRVLTSYDRSSHVADTLRDLAAAEDELKMPEEAARHRQLLSSLFPQSPAMGTPARLPEPAATGAAVKTASSSLDAPPAPSAQNAGAPAAPPTAPMTGTSAKKTE